MSSIEAYAEEFKTRADLDANLSETAGPDYRKDVLQWYDGGRSEPLVIHNPYSDDTWTDIGNGAVRMTGTVMIEEG